MAKLLSSLPGLGPRSARRAVLHLLKEKESKLKPLIEALRELNEEMRVCEICGAVALQTRCAICSDAARDQSRICVVEEMGDLWALERAGAHKGLYHILGGVLCALDGVGPEALNMESLFHRADDPRVQEVILATNATLDGQTTAHYLAEKLARDGLQLSRLARGVPVGSELDYMDDGTLADAMRQRRPF